MILYPALDLLGGRVVRLQHGQRSAARVYSEDPAETALRWAREGAEWLHVVDLDRAFGEGGDNRAAVRAVVGAVGIPVQLGGGLRTDEDVAAALELGAARVIVGTRAARDPEWVRGLIEEHGEKIAVAIDARKGIVEVQGWVEATSWDARAFAARLAQLGLRRAVVTDIERDGALSGVNLGLAADIARATGLKVIASGGTAASGELEELRALAGAGLEGIVVGRALYEGRFTLARAKELLGAGAA